MHHIAMQSDAPMVLAPGACGTIGLRDYFQEKAKVKGVEVNRLVNDLLKREIDWIESVK
jgi:hypothetical protein